MCAYRAYLRRLPAYCYVAAVRALPDAVSLSGEYKAAFDIRQKLTVSLFMFLLDLADLFKQEGNIIESFISCCPGKFCVHISPLVVLAVCRVLKILDG